MILTSRAIYLPIEAPRELVRRKLVKYVDYGFNYYSAGDFKGMMGKGWDKVAYCLMTRSTISNDLIV